MAGRESELYKDKIEVSLDGQQIFFLFFGGAIIATLVFVLGVMVGRKVQERSYVDSQDLRKNPLAALDQLEMGQDLAFPSSLRGENTTLGDVDLRLEKEMTPKPEEKAQEAIAPPQPQKPVETPKSENKEMKEKAAVERPVKPATPAISNKPIMADDKAKTGRFTLQVGSFQSKSEARDLLKSLNPEGYAPYIAEVNLDDKGTWYRVRIGKYDSYEAALSAKSSFEAKKNIIAYVTRLKK